MNTATSSSPALRARWQALAPREQTLVLAAAGVVALAGGQRPDDRQVVELGGDLRQVLADLHGAADGRVLRPVLAPVRVARLHVPKPPDATRMGIIPVCDRFTAVSGATPDPDAARFMTRTSAGASRRYGKQAVNSKE